MERCGWVSRDQLQISTITIGMGRAESGRQNFEMMLPGGLSRRLPRGYVVTGRNAKTTAMPPPVRSRLPVAAALTGETWSAGAGCRHHPPSRVESSHHR